MSFRSAVLRLVPLTVAAGVVGALLVVGERSDPAPEVDASATPAQVHQKAGRVLAPEERPAYTSADAAAVEVVDPAAPRITSGDVIAEIDGADVPTFELLGVVWDGGVPAEVSEVQVRWRQEGTWSAWTRLEFDPQAGEGGDPGTDPMWVGTSDAAEARVVSTTAIDPTGLRLVTVDPGATPTVTPTSAAVGQPAIISRAAWGASATTGCSEPRFGTMQGTVVHHTAGSNSYTAAQSAGIVKSIQAYHINGQGWCDIGYNFLIDRYGQIFEGREGGITATPRGAHAGNSDVNLNTTGVSLMGTFVSDVPPQAMKDAAVRLIAWRHSLMNVPARGTYAIGGVTLNRIDGHYRVKATACPGQQVIDWMNASGGLRDQVAAAMVPVQGLVVVPGDPKVYLVSGSVRHHVTAADDLTVLASRLGGLQTVPAESMRGIADGPAVSRMVLDPRSGALLLLQGDGTRHRFPDGDTVRAYGYGDAGIVSLTPAQVDAFTMGPEVGRAFTIENGSEVFVVDGTSKRYVTSPRALAPMLNADGFVAQMAARSAARLTDGPAVLAPRQLVKPSDEGAVFLALDDRQLIHLPSFDLAADYGLPGGFTTLPSATLTRTPRAPGSLTPVLACGSERWIAAGGGVRPLAAGVLGGLSPTEAGDSWCAALPRRAGTVGPVVLTQTVGRPEVEFIDQGQRRHVRTYAALLGLTGGAAPSIVSWRPGTAALLPAGAPILAANSTVAFAGAPEVYSGDGRVIRHIQSYATLLRLNGGRVPAIETLPSAFRGSYTLGAPIP